MRVAVTSSATSTVTASPPALTFAAENWDVPQTITLSGVDDANTTDDSATVSHAATGADYGSGVTIADVSVTVADDDAAGLKVTPTTLTVAEGGTATYSVRLNVAPTATTTVTVGGATAKVTADADSNTPGDQTTLTFDSTNWNAARTVTVSAAADADGADETVGLTHAVTGAGAYASVSLARRPGVEVRVTDAQTAGVVVSPAELTIDEGGTDTYEVRLSAPPASGTATVAVASSGAAGLTVATSTLSFDAANWNTAQTVTVTAVADHDRLTDAEGALTHSVTNYGAVESGPDVRVTVSNTTEDHDADADGLIEVDSLAKLNAMRWDLDGDGTPAAGATSTATHAAAFPNPRGGSVVPDDGLRRVVPGLRADDGPGLRHERQRAHLDGNRRRRQRRRRRRLLQRRCYGWEPIGNNVSPPSNFYSAVVPRQRPRRREPVRQPAHGFEHELRGAFRRRCNGGGRVESLGLAGRLCAGEPRVRRGSRGLVLRRDGRLLLDRDVDRARDRTAPFGAA